MKGRLRGRRPAESMRTVEAEDWEKEENRINGAHSEEAE